MTEVVEVAIEIALLTRAQTFATANSLTISLPNLPFIQPPVGVNSKYLRATLLPADPAELGISYDHYHNQYQGFMQIDVIYGKDGGERAPKRIAGAIINYFKRGTLMTSNGFNIEVIKTPALGPLMSKDSWVSLPVRIPYISFASPA